MTMQLMRAAFAVLIGAASVSAQTVGISSRIEAGESYKYTMARLITVTQQQATGSAAAGTREINQVAEVTLTADSVAPDGAASMSLRFRSLMLSMDSGTEEVIYRKAGEVVTASNETLQALGDALAASTLTYRVTAEGEVTSVGGLKPFEEAVAEQQIYEAAEVLGFFAEDALPGMLAPLYQADGASKAKRTVGRGWQDSETVALPPLAAIDIVTDWRLEAVNGDTAIMKGDIAFELRRAPNPPEDAPGLAIREGSGTTQLSWDTSKGALANRVSTQELTTVWTLGEMSLVQTQSSRLMLLRTE